MTVKTTISFTDRHDRYLKDKVGERIYASTSAAVSAAVERVIEDEQASDAAIGAMADEIRRLLPHGRRYLIFWTSIWRIRSQQLAAMIPRIALVTRKIVFFVP